MLLTAHQRSHLFSQLATMEHAGITPAQAFVMIGRDLPADARQALRQTAADLAKGADLAKAGQSSAVLLPWEVRLVRAAATGGRLESLFNRLSEHYASRAQLLDRLKSRLVFPFLILTLATFVAPFPALFQGAIGLGGYLLRAMGPPLLLYGGLRLLAFAYRQQLARETGVTWARLLLAMPVLGGLLARQQRRDGLFSLLLLLESGVPILDALPLAGKSVADPLLRARFAGAAAALADERSGIADTLQRYGVVDDASATALFASGEAAGRLDEVIRHQLRQWDAQLELRWDTLAEWVPRLFYAAVAGFMIVGIMSGFSGMARP
ncbi:MAG: type II secretion system F family protein [Candidatus Competibacter sp.]|nr:type II secretion system F family protein [Candidatus Competibacter sp.]MDG4583096.1 type II secretion system F family protein [Candidatus Competibacter sp.]